MTRRGLLLASFATVSGRADERTEILEILEPLPAALSESRGEDFMTAFSDDMADRAELRDRIAALIAFAELTSSIEVVQVHKGTAQLDWYMEIRAKATGSVVERRREKVTIRVGSRKILELRPVEFFRLPVIR